MRQLELTVDQLVDNPDNPRSNLGPVDDLAASIVELGLLQPILVCPGDAGLYIVVDGHRRTAAMRSVGYTLPFPAFVDDMDQTGRLLRAVAAGSFAQRLTVLDQARAFQQLRDLGLTQQDIAARARLRLLELDQETQAKITTGEVTLGQAHAAAQRLRKRPRRTRNQMRLVKPPDPEQHPVDLTFCLTVAGSTDHTQLGRDIADWFETQHGVSRVPHSARIITVDDWRVTA